MAYFSKIPNLDHNWIGGSLYDKKNSHLYRKIRTDGNKTTIKKKNCKNKGASELSNGNTVLS